ncbi:putative anti-sigma regulatory factor, serine/threonine protein kinase [Catenulispora acidiphila DSM 44928]|uniref:Putative anti-sigma regulatory factor, serine/threonine protein kinase n=1 Tax=Catenulispora acidiphila (strain DSM 44928 / JCM 14897 / NBRC 102108 / NRRL B-24433 / ID139908) TaxID=479433 RepID=C7Q703_CATAD|nr:ATP-binding protein [Catenulispora acidiphila]ACU76016.1 putative anti-sigma regulatory factor, serine/threonine protein kinase [Catenulispora acidiphila DSM 44928]
MDPEAHSLRTSAGIETGSDLDGEAGTEAETVVIQVPADADYLPIIRSASAHVATKLGCTLSEVADLRLAVDEACGLLLRHTVRDGDATDGANSVGDLVCRFILEGSSLRAVLSRQARNVASPQSDEFGWTILSALVDDIVWRVDGPTVHVEILKRRTGGK